MTNWTAKVIGKVDFKKSHASLVTDIEELLGQFEERVSRIKDAMTTVSEGFDFSFNNINYFRGQFLYESYPELMLDFSGNDTHVYSDNLASRILSVRHSVWREVNRCINIQKFSDDENKIWCNRFDKYKLDRFICVMNGIKLEDYDIGYTIEKEYKNGNKVIIFDDLTYTTIMSNYFATTKETEMFLTHIEDKREELSEKGIDYGWEISKIADSFFKDDDRKSRVNFNVIDEFVLGMKVEKKKSSATRKSFEKMEAVSLEEI